MQSESKKVVEKNIYAYELDEYPSNNRSITVMEVPDGTIFTGLYSSDGYPLYKVERKYPVGFGHAYN